MAEIFLVALQSVNNILEAGIAITSFSLFIRALSFNLSDRVARSFALILFCLLIVFSGEAMSSLVTTIIGLEFWLRFQWVGIVFLPTAFIHFSDALLATTGQRSRGRRKMFVRFSYFISTVFLVSLPILKLVGPVVLDGTPIPYLERTWLSVLFSVYYFIMLVLSGIFIARAYKRSVLAESRRRMAFLMGGAIALGVGAFPFILFGSDFAISHSHGFFTLALFGNIFTFASLLIMAHSVAFFGVPWPDRLVKSRLFKWLLRGPITVFVVLIQTTFLWRIGEALGIAYTVSIPVVTVATVLLMQHGFTLLSPLWERWFFHGGDRENLQLLQYLEDRLITTGDLRQFLETLLAAVCDQFQVSSAFIAAISDKGLELVVHTGNQELLPDKDIPLSLLDSVNDNFAKSELFSWGEFWLLPLYNPNKNTLLGLLGIYQSSDHEMDLEQRTALETLSHRAASALDDRRLQRQVFQALEALNPRVDHLQRLRAATRYDQRELFRSVDLIPESTDLASVVKDALRHYWGGPKLTKSPLLRLNIVQNAIEEHGGNPANALRSILRKAIESIRPEGDRRFTGEWILYNILEMKFMEGRKVRDVALRLSMSEADLYRKQRVAIEAIAEAIVEMEQNEINGFINGNDKVEYEVQSIN
jgi:hypothetical protein